MTKNYDLKKLYKEIEQKRIVLPAWQREYVWDIKQISDLFDSIYRGFPIGNILLWETNLQKDAFYEILTEIKYINGNKSETNSNEISTKSKSKVLAVIDGQQRITSLINVLFTDRIKKGEKYLSLYFNADKEKFVFLSEDKEIDANCYKVKCIFDSKIKENRHFKYSKKIAELKSKLLSCKIGYDVFQGNISDSLTVFRRLNTSGTKLTNPEINISIIINEGGTRIREEINGHIESLNSKYKMNLNLAFFVKSIIVCTLNEIKYDEDKVKENVELIKKNYRKVINSIEKICAYCYNDLNICEVLTSNNVLVPIVYYYYKYKKIPSTAFKGIKYYLAISTLFGIFGGQSDNVLKQTKEYIDNNKKRSFDLNNVKNINLKNFSYEINEKQLERLLDVEYDSEQSKMIMYLIYGNIDKSFIYYDNIVKDHIHPKKYFKNIKCFDNSDYGYKKLICLGLKKAEIFKIVNDKLWNKMPNIQLLTYTENTRGKHSRLFEDWLKENRKYKIDKTMPTNLNSMYAMKNFIVFYDNRRAKLTNILIKVLIKNDL